MALTHTQTKERTELIALSIGEIQLNRELLSDMIWRKLGSNAYLQFLSGAPEIELSLRLLVDGETAKIREYTEADLDETCLLSHIQIRPHTRHLSWRPIVTLVQNIDGVSATAVGDTGDWRHVPCTLRGGYASTLVDVLLTGQLTPVLQYRAWKVTLQFLPRSLRGAQSGFAFSPAMGESASTAEEKPPIPGISRFGASEETYLARRLTAPARNEHARYLVIRGLGSPVMYSTPSSHRFIAATRSSFVWYPHDEHL